MTHLYILGLGSNLDPQSHVAKARQLIAEKFRILKESRFIETPPVGISNQPNFINGSVLVESPLTVEEIHILLKEIEEKLGRIREPGHKSFGPRTIDIDILAIDDQVVHKDFYERNFVKESVLELSPSIRF